MLSAVGWVVAVVGSMSSGAKKFALRTQYTPNSALLCLLGEFFHTNRLRLSLGGDAAHFRLVTMGVLRHAKHCVGVSQL